MSNILTSDNAQTNNLALAVAITRAGWYGDVPEQAKNTLVEIFSEAANANIDMLSLAILITRLGDK